MHPPDRSASRPGYWPARPALWCCLLASLGAGVLCHPAAAQQRRAPELLLSLAGPRGLRFSATESWGTFGFDLTNPTDTDRLARVLVFYEGRDDLQYGRDVWVPARSNLSSWLLVGPASAQKREQGRDIRYLLYDRSEGKERLILPPTEERVRSRTVLYHKREPTTTILIDDDRTDPVFGRLPAPPSHFEEALTLVRTFRHSCELSALVPVVQADSLPALPKAFDGIDHFVLASGRIADDPAGMRALRHWLQRVGWCGSCSTWSNPTSSLDCSARPSTFRSWTGSA
jgi:hypothetical protein